ncbi:MAG: sigma-70 family RNA polymerase sigma factor [Planctomycetota bacterium]|nr:sigma-70 family RNA polymerase sigma factor [Planctomycetota bacterium]
MESTVNAMTTSFCNQLTDELMKLASVLKSRNITSQLDALDIVQMAWKSAWTKQQSAITHWDRRRIRGYLKSILLNKLKQVHRDYLDLEKRDVRRQVRFEIPSDDRRQYVESAYHAKTKSQQWMNEVFIRQMLSELSESEARIIDMKLHGWTLAEISQQTGMNRRSIQRAVLRVRERFENRWRNEQ